MCSLAIHTDEFESHVPLAVTYDEVMWHSNLWVWFTYWSRNRWYMWLINIIVWHYKSEIYIYTHKKYKEKKNWVSMCQLHILGLAILLAECGPLLLHAVVAGPLVSFWLIFHLFSAHNCLSYFFFFSLFYLLFYFLSPPPHGEISFTFFICSKSFF